jgi:hypothetical protein
VNFTVTLYVLESQLRSIILKHQKPEVDAQLQQLDSLKSECRAHLQELEDSLLSTLSECHGSLLDNDTVISALQNLKLQSSCITNRLADAESSYAAAAMTCAAITPLAHVTSCLFFELQKLRQLRSHYVLSLQSFTSNVKGGTSGSAERPFYGGNSGSSAACVRCSHFGRACCGCCKTTASLHALSSPGCSRHSPAILFLMMNLLSSCHPNLLMQIKILICLLFADHHPRQPFGLFPICRGLRTCFNTFEIILRFGRF